MPYTKMYKFRTANIIGFFILDNTDLEQQLQQQQIYNYNKLKQNSSFRFISPHLDRSNTFRRIQYYYLECIILRKLGLKHRTYDENMMFVN